MTKRLAPTGAGKSASAAEARNLGVLMSGVAWNLSRIDDQCSSFRRGHLIAWHTFRGSMAGRAAAIPVTATVDDDGVVTIEGDDLSVVGWNHRPAVLRDALDKFAGMAVWKPSFQLLTVPTESRVGGPRTVFSIALGDQRRECGDDSMTDPRPVVPRVVARVVAAPADLPGLRIGARYAVGRPGRPGSSRSTARGGASDE
jgi:hypothetical protein